MTRPTFGAPAPLTIGDPMPERPAIGPEPWRVPSTGAQLGLDGTALHRTGVPRPERLALWDQPADTWTTKEPTR